MFDISNIGAEWVIEKAKSITDSIEHVLPADYNEKNRYLPASVSPLPGYIRFDVNPYMREVVNCFDVDSDVREINLMKGVQITYSTMLESGFLYSVGHIGTMPIMYMTADKELATMRIENNFMVMLDQSGMRDLVKSSDDTSARKTGKTKDQIQFAKGAVLYPFGARNADKMRSFSIAILLKDEIDAWPDRVGKDGDPDELSDARCSAFWERRKIFRGSTPLLKHSSKIHKAYLRGDQRKYHVNCKKCGFSQYLVWSTRDNVGGFKWDYDENRTLILESVRYCCQSCGEPHFEHDKERLFSPAYGAHWRPTAKPVEPGIRSYHLPALYSPIGMQPWYKCVSSYLAGWDEETGRVKDQEKYQVFYNNILAEPYEVRGSKVKFEAVSAHRRPVYKYGEIPNKWAVQFMGSHVLLLTCQVDVHKRFLQVAVHGWTVDAKNLVIEYFRIEGTDFSDPGEPGWKELKEFIETKTWTADDGKKYGIIRTLIDAGFSNDTVIEFCADYDWGVTPILGRSRADKAQNILEFGEFTTKLGTTGYKITVDHYKDRLSSALRREWEEANGMQKVYHFNAPWDMKDESLRELTVEQKLKKTDERGVEYWYWHRPGNARNELWDLTCYGHASIEILAWEICTKQFDIETIDWPQFWEFISTEQKYYIDADEK